MLTAKRLSSSSVTQRRTQIRFCKLMLRYLFVKSNVKSKLFYVNKFSKYMVQPKTRKLHQLRIKSVDNDLATDLLPKRRYPDAFAWAAIAC